MIRDRSAVPICLLVLSATTKVPGRAAMCGRIRLSSDVSEIKLVFSIPPHRPTPNTSSIEGLTARM
jgi:hypothetical protein